MVSQDACKDLIAWALLQGPYCEGLIEVLNVVDPHFVCYFFFSHMSSFSFRLLREELHRQRISILAIF